MHTTFPGVVTAVPSPKTLLITTVLANLPALPKFEDIQRVLGEQCVALFGLSIDFTRKSDSSPVTQHEVDTLMRFDEDTTPEEYVEALLGMCAANMWVSIPTPLFTVFQRILR